MRSSSAARWPALAVAGSLVAAGALVTVKNGMVTDQLVGFGKQNHFGRCWSANGYRVMKCRELLAALCRGAR